MSGSSLASVYTMAQSLADRLPDASREGRVGLAQACLKGILDATTAVVEDAGRVTADEERAAKRLRAELLSLDGQAADPRAAGTVADMVKRWLGPNGLPADEEAEFDRLAALLRGPHPSK